MKTLIFVLFMIFSKCFIYAAYEDEQYNMQDYIDCGVPEGSVRGGQFSKAELDSWCAEIKEKRKNKIFLYSGIGLVVLIIGSSFLKKGGTYVKNKSELQSLCNAFNGIYLLITELEIQYSKLEETSKLNDELKRIQNIFDLEIEQRLINNDWNGLTPIQVPAISNDTISLDYAVKRCKNKIHELSNKIYE